MNLSGEQSAFLEDVSKLIIFVHNVDGGVLMTEGEGYRTLEQQQIYFNAGKSKTMNSNHLRRLAHDFNFVKDGQMITDHATLKKYGDFWESLNPLNRWGGNFSNLDDYDHFERAVS
jgi:D-alanyl-D-alanine carboxypeptidase